MYSGVLFNSQDLTLLTGVQINRLESYNRPNRSVNRSKLPRRTGSKVVNTEYAEKVIVADGILTGTSRSNWEVNRDNLLRYLDPEEATLRIPQSGANRDYTATVDNVLWNEQAQGGFATFSIQFVCADPLGYNTTSTTDISGVTITTASSTRTFAAIGGSFKALPTVTALLNSGTGLTNKAVTFTDQTGHILTVTRTWTATDSLVIDSLNQTVKVNGTAVDYSGNFPVLAVADTQLSIADGLTTRNWTLTMVHKSRWL